MIGTRCVAMCFAGLLAASGLAGCGDGNGDMTTTTATEATVAPGPANTAAVPTTDGAPDQDGS